MSGNNVKSMLGNIYLGRTQNYLFLYFSVQLFLQKCVPHCILTIASYTTDLLIYKKRVKEMTNTWMRSEHKKRKRKKKGEEAKGGQHMKGGG